MRVTGKKRTEDGIVDELLRENSYLGMLPDGLSRRRFLSLLSASAAFALGTTACSRIDRGSIVPYTRKPDEIVPGVANYYASTFQEGLTAVGVLVKTREGRPIHIEGNPECPHSHGKIGLRAIADILSLYDPDRLRQPHRNNTPTTWSQAQNEIVKILQNAKDKPVLLLTGAVVSPTQKALIENLKQVLPSLQHRSWEPIAPYSELSATRSLFGQALLPEIHLNKARVILSLQADLLGSSGNAAAIHDFASKRRPEHPANEMNRLWVVEGTMSLTGANADHRIRCRPSQIPKLAFALIRELHEVHGLPLPSGITPDLLPPSSLKQAVSALQLSPVLLKALANDLKEAGNDALVVAGSAVAPEGHIAAALLNQMLGSEGTTLTYQSPPDQLIDFREMHQLLDELSGGHFGAAIFWRTNPAYSFPNAAVWQKAIAQIPVKIAIGLYADETAAECQWQLPEHHWLESWGDFQTRPGILMLRQPTIGPLHDTRQGEDILLDWIRALGSTVPENYHVYLKDRWQKHVYPAGSPAPFEAFWNASLHDGVLKQKVNQNREDQSRERQRAVPLNPHQIRNAADGPIPENIELVLQPGCSLYDGRYANNGWLQELPDPVTKATWMNPLMLSSADAQRLRLSDNQLTMIETGDLAIEVSVMIQPGQTPGVAGIALGYGRKTASVANGVGANSYALININSDSPYLLRTLNFLSDYGQKIVPRTQEHHQIGKRDLIRSWTRSEYLDGSYRKKLPHAIEHASLIPDLKFPEHKWGMVVDLSACVGCSSCVIACQSENNIPVVGPEQVIHGREMHWMRIDRYYSGNLEDPSVLHQPMLCQQCDNAPCEIVCPVNATTHSADGLNQMTYNRCVGTRYCSNNCPFKVRRFNFFEYANMKKAPETLVFNPEVTVRPRGVMEKCSFCIQRIQDARQKAKVAGRKIEDGEIRPACVAACPANALIFGDLNNPASRIAQLAKSPRAYRLLEELGIRPSVTYLADLKNPAIDKEGKA